MNVLESWVFILGIVAAIAALAWMFAMFANWLGKNIESRWYRKHYSIDYHNMEKHRTRWENR